MGFNKTSITCFSTNEIIFLNVLPIGGNHITKDISKVLEISMEKSEHIKINFDENPEISDKKNELLDILQKVIFARTDEILELSKKSIKSNSLLTDVQKVFLTGEGSKIFKNKYNNKIFPSINVDFLEENLEDICKSGFRLISKPNKQEVIVVPKKPLKEGFFEKLFHLFR